MRIIRGKYGRRRFDVPSNISARPTTDFARENIFNVIENLIDLEGAVALDPFAGTGAVSFEFLSRECESVTSVEKSHVQFNFIRKVRDQLNVKNMTLIKGDVFRFIETTRQKFDVIFVDPPYDLPNFGEIPGKILASELVKPGTVFVMEHSKNYDFSQLPHFHQHRAYGSVNFSIFIIGEAETDNEADVTTTQVDDEC